MQHPGDGIAKLRAVNWAISLEHCGFNSVSYNTTALICKTEARQRSSRELQWKTMCQLPEFNLDKVPFSETKVWGSVGVQVPNLLTGI